MIELKTLKDIEKKYYASGSYDSDGYLATEDKFSVGEGHLFEIDDLKAEAINWIKKEDLIIDNFRTAFKYFFNLTEEDLK